MGDAGNALIWLFGTLLGVILTIVLNEPVQSAAARLAAGFIPRSPRNLTGLWRLEYEYVVRGVKTKEVQIVEIKSFAGAVYGRTVFSQVHKYEIKGRLKQELYFTGYWHSILPGHAYHGAFQLILHPDGSELTGKWLGFSEKLQTVNHDAWVWQRLSHKVTRAERKRLSELLQAEMRGTSGTSTSAAAV